MFFMHVWTVLSVRNRIKASTWFLFCVPCWKDAILDKIFNLHEAAKGSGSVLESKVTSPCLSVCSNSLLIGLKLFNIVQSCSQLIN